MNVCDVRFLCIIFLDKATSECEFMGQTMRKEHTQSLKCEHQNVSFLNHIN